MIDGSPIIPRISFNQSVHFRKGAVSVLKEIINKRVLVIAYPEADDNENYQKSLSNLESSNVSVEKCNSATLSEVDRLVTKYRNDIDIIVAIGGGQVMDTSKFVRVALENLGKDPATIFEGNLNQNGYVLEEGGVNHWSFGIAYEFATNIFFGASVNYNVGSFLSDGEFTEADQDNNYNDTLRTVADNPLTAGFQSFYINDINDWVFNGVDFRIGVMYKLFDFIFNWMFLKLDRVISISNLN